MRQDQFTRLQALTEKLIDVYLTEADPASWPGQGLKLGDMDAKTRGDLYWCRKTAASALALAIRTESFVGTSLQRGAGLPPAPTDGEESTVEDDIEREISSYEREAQKLIDQAQGTAKKAAFDKRVHGK